MKFFAGRKIFSCTIRNDEISWGMIKPASMPDDFHPGLTPARLRVVGNLIRKARRHVSLRYEPDRGDDAWTQGCRAYRWSCHAIEMAADSEDHPWLKVVNSGLQFVFSVAGTPLRFYRGEPDEPPGRYRHRTFEELRVVQESLPLDVAPFPAVMRLAVETDAQGLVTEVSLVRLTKEGEPLNVWVVPGPEEDGPDGLSRLRGAGPVVLPDPDLRPKRDRSDDSTSETGE